MTAPSNSAGSGGSCCSGSDCCSPPSRRGFLKNTGLVGLGVLAAPIVAGPFTRDTAGQTTQQSFIPFEKHLDPAWLKGLFERGQQKVYRGEELKTIAMPVGGMAAGQVYLAGDGRLAHWDIFNHTPDTGPGDTRYATLTPSFPLEQGFSIAVTRAGSEKSGKVERTLDANGFPGVEFVGEYPMAWVKYADADVPVGVTLEAFSPFIPLNAADSALPATVLRFRLENRSAGEVRAELTGWLENAVARYSKDSHAGRRVNRAVRGDGVTILECLAEPDVSEDSGDARPAVVFADFEGKDYGDWKAEGDAFGSGPARGTIPPQQPVSGFQGQGLVNSFNKRDKSTGKLTSPSFTIERPFVNFLIGGGGIPGKTCMNLVVDGQVVRTATGRNNERLDWQTWNVRPLIGRIAHIEMVDEATGPWGHINVDQIEFADRPAAGTPALSGESDFGTMALAVVGDGTVQPARGSSRGSEAEAKVDLLEKLVGGVSREVTLAAGASTTITFVVAWHFANRADRGQFYATRFADASAVARHVAANLERLAADTRLWHDTYYDSTLPHWFLDRVHMPVANLATSTVQWWQNGRFWAWEGVGCCHGTCTHVWNYAQAMARLFPQLERSAREMQDFGAGFHEDGLVGFRGGNEYAADGQAGTVLKAYREHLCSADEAFLRRNWPRIRKAIEFLIGHDGNDDGLIEDPQHNTYDIWFHGPNTFVGALYLAALRASEEMARRMGDSAFAERCRRIFTAGSRWSDQHLFDGEYFFQQVDLKQWPEHQYDHGCLSDQLFGQNWAAQVGLGYVYDREHVRTALRSVYKYNWTPDVGPYNREHPPQRWFARPGDAGLITCTFPKSAYLAKGVLYREEVWTGIEYQVASHLIQEGMLEEAFAILRGVHDRYDPRRHNPWNEIECGDHYARSLASWGCLTAISGFQYDGPAGRLSFAPKLNAEDFRCAFTAAEGWGTYAQSRERVALALKWGTLRLTQLGIPVRPGTPTVALNGKPVNYTGNASHEQWALAFKDLALKAGDELVVS